MGLIHSASTIVTDGLAFCLDAANKRSYPGTGTTWTDIIGSNIGTLTNGLTFDAANAGSLIFDGTDDYVEFSDSMIDPNQNWTLSTFINRSGSQTSTIIGSAGGQALQVRIDGTGYYEGHIKVLHSTLAGVATFTNFGPRGSSDRSLGVWYNITITKSSYTYSLYIDGEFNQSVTDGSSVTFNNSPNIIGSRMRTNELFNGKLSNLSFYNRALTAAEILQNYEATKGRYQ
jgi:hypothetical protein